VSAFTLRIEGKPVGKGRPRFGQGRTWTPRETVLAEQEIRRAWEEAGAPRLEGALKILVLLRVTRPQSHYTSSGGLSAQGRRHVFPHRQKPDTDNALKLVMDALNTRAWADDVQIVDATVVREWAEVPSTLIDVQELVVRTPELVAA
jgi:Holliday junction resolvase RusA-like endonuclease